MRAHEHTEQQMHGKEQDAENSAQGVAPRVKDLLQSGKAQTDARPEQAVFVDVLRLDDPEDGEKHQEFDKLLCKAGKEKTANQGAEHERGHYVRDRAHSRLNEKPEQ